MKDGIYAAERRPVRRGLSYALGVVCLGFVGCSDPTTFSVASTTHAIAGGNIAPESDAIFSLQVRLGGGAGSRLCTASLLAPNLFLTARHCLVDGITLPGCGDSFPPLVDPSAVDLTNPTRLDSEEATLVPVLHGARFEVPPLDDLCGADMALIMTEERIDSVTPLVPHFGPVVAGQSYSAVGYGMIGELSGGEGARRRLDDLEVRCVGAKCGSTVSAGEFLGADGPCEGDSGGPSLLPTANGERILGVLSRGAADCTQAVYGASQNWAEFLRTAAVQAATLGDYSPPAWAQLPIEEPPEPAAGGAGGATTDFKDPDSSPPAIETPSSSSGSGGCQLTPSTGGADWPLTMGFLVTGLIQRRRRRQRSTKEGSVRVSTTGGDPRRWTGSGASFVGAIRRAAPLAWVPIAIGCQQGPQEFQDTEGRVFVAECVDGRCRYQRKQGPDSAESSHTVTVEHKGRLLAVCDTSDAPQPAHCRPVTCSGKSCPTLSLGARLSCEGGLCIDPSRELEPVDTRLLCLAGTGLGRSARQAERLALAAACTPPCEVPAACRQP